MARLGLSAEGRPRLWKSRASVVRSPIRICRELYYYISIYQPAYLYSPPLPASRFSALEPQTLSSSFLSLLSFLFLLLLLLLDVLVLGRPQVLLFVAPQLLRVGKMAEANHAVKANNLEGLEALANESGVDLVSHHARPCLVCLLVSGVEGICGVGAAGRTGWNGME